MSKYETELKNYLERAILLAPCTIITNSNPIASFKVPGALEEEMKKADVYAVFGPNFNKYDKDTICAKVSEDACKFVGLMDEFFKDEIDRNPMSLHLDTHISQMRESNSFQEFSSNWETTKKTV